MSPKFLKSIHEFIVRPVYLLLRKSLDEGHVPLDWKSTTVIPVFKKGNRCRAENYRPISLTVQICKVAEAIIRDAATKHLETHKLIRLSTRFRSTSFLSHQSTLISRQGY